jgi:hypothetical protein
MKINVSEWELEDEPEVETKMKKPAKNADFGELTRLEALTTMEATLLKAPGIPGIKRCELFNKYRSLVPEPYRDVICPKPPQEILDNQKKIKNDKTRAKAHEKKKKAAKRERKETTADERKEEVAQQAAVAAVARLLSCHGCRSSSSIPIRRSNSTLTFMVDSTLSTASMITMHRSMVVVILVVIVIVVDERIANQHSSLMQHSSSLFLRRAARVYSRTYCRAKNFKRRFLE